MLQCDHRLVEMKKSVEKFFNFKKVHKNKQGLKVIIKRGNQLSDQFLTN